MALPYYDVTLRVLGTTWGIRFLERHYWCSGACYCKIIWGSPVLIEWLRLFMDSTLHCGTPG